MTSADRHVVIVGAGPTGIACAIELQKVGVEAVCYDKGCLLNSIYHFPEEMRWFSTRDLLDIGGIPFPSPDAHPTRLESLAYYRGVVEKFRVHCEPETEIVEIRPDSGRGLRVVAAIAGESRSFSAAAAIIATGFFHNPKKLDAPGADLPHVSSCYISAYPFHGRDVVVVGGKNSAAEAALDLYRHGARVTMVVRGPAISERVKYWIKPDLENRIRDGAIRAFFQSRVGRILPREALLDTPRGEVVVPADAIFPLIGYEPDFAFLERCGIGLEGEKRIPAHDVETLESSVPGIYLAGAVLSGIDTGRIFIENSRGHAAMIAHAIAARRSTIHA